MKTAEFFLSRSKSLFYCFHTLYLCALLVIVTLSISWPWKIVGCLLLAWFWKRERSMYSNTEAYHRPNDIAKIWHEAGNRFRVELHNGYSYRAILKGDSYKCPWFIILRLKRTPHKSQKYISSQANKFNTLRPSPSLDTEIPPHIRTSTIFIAKDSMSHLEYRTLCARLLSF